MVYLPSFAQSKEQVALRIAQDDNIQCGLICVLSCIELCRSYTIRKNKETKRLELVSATRKCLFLYFYFLDREFGLMHVRLQTWLPMPIQVCLNGREYLARRLDKAGMGYEKRDNCFTRIDDLGRPYRALRPLAPEEARWFAVLMDAKFMIQGFRNRDLRQRLWPTLARTPEVRRQAAGRVTRYLRLLRAHGLIRKVSKTSYYRITDAGQRLMTTVLQILDLDTKTLAA